MTKLYAESFLGDVDAFQQKKKQFLKEFGIGQTNKKTLESGRLFHSVEAMFCE